METSDRIDAVLRQVRERGGRATSARRAILQTLVDHHDVHPTVEHITSSVQVTHPDIAESTVYRFLDELERLGIVEHVRLGHGPAVYHFAEDTHHHHLVCELCGAVAEVPQRLFDSLRLQVLRDFAFEIEPRHFTLTGRCVRCADSAVAGTEATDTPHGAPPGHSHTHTHTNV